MISDSAYKHGVVDETIWYVMENNEIVVLDPDQDGSRTALFIGHPHPQALPTDYVEVLGNLLPNGEAVIFHAAPLQAKFRSRYGHRLSGLQ